MGQQSSSEAKQRQKSLWDGGFFPVNTTGKEGYCNSCDSLRLLFTWQYNEEKICVNCVMGSLQETIRDAKLQDWEFYENK